MKAFSKVTVWALLVGSTSSFLAKPTFSARMNTHIMVELTPEPDGGEEMVAVVTMEGSRMKNMGESPVKSDDGQVFKFWLQAKAQGELINGLNKQIMLESKKKANFPGFRKGQIPPYAMGQIRGFALQEGIVQTVQAGADAYGLKSISGSDGEVEVLEKVAEMAESYKLGDEAEFTATFNAVFDPEKQSQEETPDTETDSTAIDVEVEEA